MKDTQKKYDDSEIDRSIKKHVKEIYKMEVDDPHVKPTLVVGVVSAVAALVAAYIITK